jgi:hypothetical protein
LAHELIAAGTDDLPVHRALRAIKDDSRVVEALAQGIGDRERGI